MGAEDISSVSQKHAKIEYVDSAMSGLTMLMDCCCPWGMYLPRTLYPNTVFYAMGEFLGPDTASCSKTSGITSHPNSKSTFPGR